MRRSKKATSSCRDSDGCVGIPQDLIDSEILPRLPVQSLVRFKSVAKHWHSLISSDAFVKHHYLQSQTNTSLIIQRHGRLSNKCTSSRLFILDVILDHNAKMEKIEARNLVLPEFDDEFKKVKESKVVGSCNGLICMQLVDGYNKFRFLIWNPMTRETRLVEGLRLPILRGHTLSIGFGSDSSSNDYKIVVLCQVWTMAPTIYSPLVKLYSLRNRQWKPLHGADCLPLLHTRVHTDQARLPVLVGDTLHWLFRVPKQGWTVLALNLCEESFSVLPQPNWYVCNKKIPNVARNGDVFLCEIRHRLCACWMRKTGPERNEDGMRNPDRPVDLEVWMLEQCGLQNTWRKSVHHHDFDKHFQSMFRSNHAFHLYVYPNLFELQQHKHNRGIFLPGNFHYNNNLVSISIDSSEDHQDALTSMRTQFPKEYQRHFDRAFSYNESLVSPFFFTSRSLRPRWARKQYFELDEDA